MLVSYMADKFKLQVTISRFLRSCKTIYLHKSKLLEVNSLTEANLKYHSIILLGYTENAHNNLAALPKIQATKSTKE